MLLFSNISKFSHMFDHCSLEILGQSLTIYIQLMVAHALLVLKKRASSAPSEFDKTLFRQK